MHLIGIKTDINFNSIMEYLEFFPRTSPRTRERARPYLAAHDFTVYYAVFSSKYVAKVKQTM